MMLTKKGFTLLEALLAMALFAVGIVAVARLFSIGLVSSADVENTAVAMNLAQQRIEEVRNISYTSIANEAKAVVSGFSAFQRDVAVTEPLTDLKRVTVNVYWQSKGSEANVSLITYISKN